MARQCWAVIFSTAQTEDLVFRRISISLRHNSCSKKWNSQWSCAVGGCGKSECHEQGQSNPEELANNQDAPVLAEKSEESLPLCSPGPVGQSRGQVTLSAIPEQLRKPRTISPSLVCYPSSTLSLQPYQFQTSALGFVCCEPELPGSNDRSL